MNASSNRGSIPDPALRSRAPLRAGARRVLLVALGVALAGVVHAADPAPAASAAPVAPAMAFAQGNEAYRAKDYQKALESYRAVRVENAVVHYNTGCAAYKAGRLGEAILNFEKARRIAPRDADVNSNLAFARARVKDAVPEDDSDLVSRLVFGALDRLSMNEVAGLALLSWWLLGGCVLALVLARDPARRSALRWPLAGLVVLLAVAGGAFALKYANEEYTPHAIVLARELPVLSGPAADEIKRFTLHEGTKVRVIKEWDRWIHVALPSGENGWAAAEAVGKI